jgi:hypothetical protein
MNLHPQVEDRGGPIDRVGWGTGYRLDGSNLTCAETPIVKIEYSTLLDLMPGDEDRLELNRLSKEYYESGQTASASPNERGLLESKRSQLLDELLEKIQWHMRAMRHPMPNREELAEMVKERFEQ